MITTENGVKWNGFLGTMQKIEKDELASYQMVIKEMINDNINVTNDLLDKIL